jgi:hypothetical protein
MTRTYTALMTSPSNRLPYVLSIAAIVFCESAGQRFGKRSTQIHEVGLMLNAASRSGKGSQVFGGICHWWEDERSTDRREGSHPFRVQITHSQDITTQFTSASIAVQHASSLVANCL